MPRPLRAALAALVLAAFPAAASEPPAKTPLQTIAEAGTTIRQMASNALVKVRHGVVGVGEDGAGAAGPGGCCAMNLERIRAALDSIRKEGQDLRRTLEKDKKAEGLEALDRLLAHAREVGVGADMLAAATDSASAHGAVGGMAVQMNNFDRAWKDLVACCGP